MSSDISYVALETTDSSLIGNYPDIAVWGDRIVISSLYQPLLVFDRKDGHFCNTVGHIGDDPEGCATDGWGSIPFWIDQTNGTVYLRTLGDRGLLRYDMDGRFLGKTSPDMNKWNITSLAFMSLHISNDTVFAHNKYIRSDNNPFLLSFSGITGEILDSVPLIGLPLPVNIISSNYMYGTHVPYGGMGMFIFDYPDNQTLRIVPSAPSVWGYGGRRYIKEAFIDTVYTVGTHSLTPRFALDLGTWRWPYDKRLEKENSGKRISIDYLLENETLIYFHFHTGLYERRKEDAHSYCGFYNKRSGMTKVKKGDAITDDLYHFLPLTIRRVSSDGEFVGLIQASDILDRKKKTATDNPEIKALLNVNEEDNPIVVFIK
jgi:hypothetical protein